MWGGGLRKIKICEGGLQNFPFRPPLRISNGIALKQVEHGDMAKNELILIFRCRRPDVDLRPELTFIFKVTGVLNETLDLKVRHKNMQI